MKKLFLSLFLIGAVSFGMFAQKSNVSKAKNLTEQEKPDFSGARAAIKEAISNDATKSDPNTYYTAGMIGYTENDKLNTLLMLGKENEVNKDKKGEAIMESYKYFMKAYELDQAPNAKGKVKPRFTKRIKDNVKEFYTAQYNLIAYGAQLFDKRDYKGAVEVFNTFLEIPKSPLMNNEIPTNDSTYHMIKYFNALATTNLQDHAKAIELYEDLKNDNYETKNVYQLLAEEYRMTEDFTKYLATLEKGFNLFPQDPWFLQNIINHYINNQKVEDAAKYLDAAIAQAPNVAEYHYVKGNIEERLGNVDAARKAFERAIEIQPTMASAYAGIGRVIFNQGVEILKAADNIRDNKLYNAEVDKANVVFVQSAPFFEKAVEIDPSDIDTKQALKMLYYRLKDMSDYSAKYDALVKELGE